MGTGIQDRERWRGCDSAGGEGCRAWGGGLWGWVLGGWLAWRMGMVLAAAGAGADVGGTRFSETALKGAFTFNFCTYVTWPASRWPGPRAPLVIGVLGRDEVAEVLEDLVRRKPVEEHPREVRRLRTVAEAQSCHVVYVGPGQEAAPVMAAVAGGGVLLVGETESFLEAGGHIQLARSGERVVFDVNDRAVEASGLQLSSKVLALARKVVGVKSPGTVPARP